MPRASLAPPLVPPFRHISVSMAGIWGSRSSAVLQLKMAKSHCFEAVHLYIPSCTAVHCPCEMLLWDDMTITILISYIMHVFLAPEASSHISLSITFLFLISCGILADALLHLNIRSQFHSLFSQPPGNLAGRLLSEAPRCRAQACGTALLHRQQSLAARWGSRS